MNELQTKVTRPKELRDDYLDAVAGQELAHDRHNRMGLGLITFKTADLEREAIPVDEQTDDHLRIHPSLFGESDFPQFILFSA